MTLNSFEQLDTDQKAIALLSANLLADIPSQNYITQLYALGEIFIKITFCTQRYKLLEINAVTAIDELLPFKLSKVA